MEGREEGEELTWCREKGEEGAMPVLAVTCDLYQFSR